MIIDRAQNAAEIYMCDSTVDKVWIDHHQEDRSSSSLQTNHWFMICKRLISKKTQGQMCETWYTYVSGCIGTFFRY